MKFNKKRVIAASVIFVAAVVLIVGGIVALSMRHNAGTFKTLGLMRQFTVISAAHQPLVDQRVQEASNIAYDYAKEQGMSRNARAAYTLEKETEAKTLALTELKSRFGAEAPQIAESINALDEQLISYFAALKVEEDAFLATKGQATTPVVEETSTEQAATAETSEGGESEAPAVDDMRPVIDDLSGFVPSAALKAQKDALKPYTEKLMAAMSAQYPDIPAEGLAKAEQQVVDAVRGKGDSFESTYDRSVKAGADSLLSQREALVMQGIRLAENFIYIGVGLLLLGFGVLFYKQAVKKLGTPRFVILSFFLLLLVLAGVNDIQVNTMLGNVLKRTGMYGVLALAMLPGIQSGISLNLGMPIGIISGLISTLLALEYNMTGWTAFVFAVVVGALLALPVGYFYGKLLNKLKGSEMTVSTYVGLSYVSLFSIAWMLLPFRNPKITWALGTGLRLMHNMKGSIGGILDNFLSFRILGVQVPTGLILFLLLACLVMYLFERSKTGVAMVAGGSNAAFARASGINVDRTRIIGTTLSTMIAAIGIIVYSSSFGFMQLYSGPRQMGFVAASAILIGGATVSKAKVSHVLIGTFLFQGVLALGIQVANTMIDVSGLSEVMRIMISNGIILYALTQAGGQGRD